MRRPTRTTAHLLPAWLLLLVALLPAASADEKGAGLPFHERVNKALEEGVDWLLARPMVGRIPGTELEGAHWGLINGTQIYGGGTGEIYRHPAGPSALALYTLLKCGIDPEHETVEKGFHWLRADHTVTKGEKDFWDGTLPAGQPRRWTHTMAASSYELAVMILALTAKYDADKGTAASRRAHREGKLKIRDRADRAWLRQMVAALLDRRGRPVEEATPVAPVDVRKYADPLKYDDFELRWPEGGLPPEPERLGWRYNPPHIDLTASAGRSTQHWKRRVRIPPHANQDMSSTNLAALALFSAQRFRVDVPASVWQDIVRFTLDHQEEDGPEVKRHAPGFQPDRYGEPPTDKARGFVYIKGSTDGSEGKATRSMTACGIANLLIAREMIAKDKKARRAFTESGRLKEVDTAIADGLAWLDRNWSTFTNTHSRYGYHIYHLYCVERAMDILGKELIGKRLWYKPGAEEILDRQKTVQVQVPQPKGGTQPGTGVYWQTGATHDPKDVLDTCFALLYLKRATRGLRPAAVTGD